MFDKHKANEANYRRKLKSCIEAYLKFRYESPFVIPKDSFDTLDFNQYGVGPW